LSTELANQLLEAGVHFGHQTRKWNPKMKRYIYGAKNGVYIIDLAKTVGLIDVACKYLTKTTASGGRVLFVGTKPQAKEIIRESATATGMPFVNNRWLGGLLTNFETLRKSVKRYLDLKTMTTDGTLEKISKKEGSMIKKEIIKLAKNLEGVSDMEKLPAAMFVVDAKRENIAVREAVKLGIPVVAITDTDANPDLIQYPIPGNDDAIRSIKFLTKKVTDAILAGKNSAPRKASADSKSSHTSEATETSKQLS
jgi:small subunit ribosomal protein S2